MTTVPRRPSNPVVAPHTSSTSGARMGSGMWTVKAASARSGRQVTVPVTISTGSWRMGASLVLDSPSAGADPCSLGVTADMTLATVCKRNSMVPAEVGRVGCTCIVTAPLSGGCVGRVVRPVSRATVDGADAGGKHRGGRWPPVTNAIPLDCGAAAAEIGAASRHSVTRRGPGPVAASASCALQ